MKNYSIVWTAVLSTSGQQQTFFFLIIYEITYQNLFWIQGYAINEEDKLIFTCIRKH